MKTENFPAHGRHRSRANPTLLVITVNFLATLFVCFGEIQTGVSILKTISLALCDLGAGT